jgi:hypothetical protein
VPHPTTTKTIKLILFTAFTLSLTGCRGALPCPDCDPDDDPMAEGAVPDLPCGGADLQTDALNCGSCEQFCWDRPLDRRVQRRHAER